MGIFKNSQQSAEITEMYISVGSVFEGNIRSEGDVRVDGRVDGNIHAAGSVTSGPGSSIMGDIAGEDVMIGGTLRGNVTASGIFGAGPMGDVLGDVTCSGVSIERGAEYRGSISVTGGNPPRRRSRGGSDDEEDAGE